MNPFSTTHRNNNHQPDKTMNQTSEQTTKPVEEFVQLLVEKIAEYPSVGRPLLNLQKSIFEAAETSGVNPVFALALIFRDMLQAYVCNMKVECTERSLKLGEIPEYIVEELKEMELKTTEE